MATLRNPAWLNPSPHRSEPRLWTFTSERSAVRFTGQIFAPHWCIADRRSRRHRVMARPFVVCDPRTAKRHGWKVVRAPQAPASGSGR